MAAKKDSCRSTRRIQSSYPAGVHTKRCYWARKTEVRAAYGDGINPTDHLTLQIKDHKWQGMFIDFFGDDIEDRSIFRVLVEKSEVRLSRKFRQFVCMHVTVWCVCRIVCMKGFLCYFNTDWFISMLFSLPRYGPCQYRDTFRWCSR